MANKTTNERTYPNEKKMKKIRCKDFCNRPFNILDQLEVILFLGKQNNKWKVITSVFACPSFRPIGGHLNSSWPKMWPEMTTMNTIMTFCIPCHMTYQMKGNDFSIWPFNALYQLEVIWRIKWHIKWKVMTSVFYLSMC